MRAIVTGPSDPARADPSIQPWIALLSAPATPPVQGIPSPTVAGWQGDDPSQNALDPSTQTKQKGDEETDPEVAYAGTLIGQVHDPRIPETHCTYYHPGLPTFTIPWKGYVDCPETAPAPGGYRRS